MMAASSVSRKTMKKMGIEKTFLAIGGKGRDCQGEGSRQKGELQGGVQNGTTGIFKDPQMGESEEEKRIGDSFDRSNQMTVAGLSDKM
jgi:hypothetical protein